MHFTVACLDKTARFDVAAGSLAALHRQSANAAATATRGRRLVGYYGAVQQATTITTTVQAVGQSSARAKLHSGIPVSKLIMQTIYGHDVAM